MLIPCIQCANPTPPAGLEDGVCYACRKPPEQEEDRRAKRIDDALGMAEMTRAERAALKASIAPVRKPRKPAAPDAPPDQVSLVEAELARRALARRKLMPFVMRFNDAYHAGWVHKIICQELERFETEVIEKKSPRLIIEVPPRHGKQIADSCPVLTTAGWRTHGELRPGDQVFHPSGRAIRVLAVAPPSDEKLEVTFTNGERIRCHPEHEWALYDRSAHQWRTLETREIGALPRRSGAGGLWTGVRGARGGRAMFQLPDVAAMEFPEATLPIDPYWFGLWLGDGKSTDPQLTSCEADAQVFRAAAGYDVSAEWVHPTTGVRHLSFARQGLRKQLRGLGVLNAKRIPALYKFSAAAQRIELLAGLVDTDGHVERGTGRVRIVTVSKELANDIHELATTLGFRPYISVQLPGTSTSGIVGKRVVYTIGFQPTVALPCRLARKQAGRVAPRRAIGVASIEPCDPEPGRCIQVDSPDGLYLVGRSLIPTHNSELVSRMFPAWFLGRNPEMEVIAASHTTSLSMDFSRKVRGIFRSDSFATVFTDARMSDDSQAAEHWRTTRGGGYTAVGVGSAVVGKGAHILCVDDPVAGAEDAESFKSRETVKNWYQTEAYTRLAPGGGVLIIMQRWHDEDLAGWLLNRAEKGDGEPWRVVRFPAIAEDDEQYRRKGEALHPERYPIELLEGIRRNMTPRQWEALYQQNPVPDTGSYFLREYFNFYAPEDLPPLDTMNVYSTWDLAIGTKEQNDFTAGLTAGLTRNQDIYILDHNHGRWPAMEIVERVLDDQKRWGAQIVGMEKGHIQMTLGPFMAKRMAERRQMGFLLHPLAVGRRDKQARARSIQGRMQQGKVFWPARAPWLSDVQRELMRFPNGAHDDRADALGHLGLLLDEMVPMVAPRETVHKSWRDRLRSATSSTSRSAMSA